MLLVGCLRVGGGVLSTTWGAVSNVPNWPLSPLITARLNRLLLVLRKKGG